MVAWHEDPHLNTTVYKYRLLGQGVVGGLSIQIRCRVVPSVGEVGRRDLDVVEAHHCGKGPHQATVVAEVGLCLAEVAASHTGRRSAEGVVAFFPYMDRHRNCAAVDEDDRSYRRFGAVWVLDSRSRHSAHEAAVVDLAHLHAVVVLHVYHIDRRASICLGSRTRFVGRPLLGLQRVLVEPFALHAVSACRIHANLPSAADPLVALAADES